MSPASNDGTEPLTEGLDRQVQSASTRLSSESSSSVSGRPRLLDLFCGAGGAAMGYSRAGFEVVGVDIKPQPNYPFEFHRADALHVLSDHETIAVDLPRFDAIHASPPCQAFSKITNRSRGRGGIVDHRGKHEDLLEPTRELLRATGLPYVIENVPGAPLENPVQFCGSFFGLDVQRHRHFEANFPLFSTPCSHHWQTPRFRSLDSRQKAMAHVVGVHGHLNYRGEREIREKAMDIDWMEPHELNEAIPPAYTEFIGEQLMAHLKALENHPEPDGYRYGDGGQIISTSR